MPRKPPEFYSEEFENQVVKVWKDRENLYGAEKVLLDKFLKDKKAKICDAGTGSGRIAFYLEEEGFEDIHGFDLSKRMIDEAEKKAGINTSKIGFRHADACDLSLYPDNHFQYLVYLQQVLSMIPEDQLGEALREAFRIGQPGSIYIFSFMDWRARKYNPLLSLIVNSVRFFTFRKTSKYYLPELTLNGRFNKGFLSRNQHPIWWPKMEMVIPMLEETGFEIVTTHKQNEVSSGGKEYAFYLICSKKG
ncbi:class I SAM-dependent methyltransferase [Muriicola marianensis]|uniref:Methyltransferase domain-containing protein n=1 Tax=Muriicola marianensis TaxID=1324801 RepID=A0ABQ1QTS4_9FLAO|nr:class I SAM-dependent methyltransferase [Muriicola marianensis]GGD41109.1 hypothetical protein GCM10011361_05260 [Muriicola marianensis]